MENDDCNNSLLRLFPRIDLNKIKSIFDEIPNKLNEHLIISDAQRNLYLKSLEYKYLNVLKPIYIKLLEKNKSF